MYFCSCCYGCNDWHLYAGEIVYILGQDEYGQESVPSVIEP